MKTAMQELLDVVRYNQQKYQMSKNDIGANISLTYLHVQQLIELAIEKEKQQIIAAYEEGDIERFIKSGEDYFTQTFPLPQPGE